MKYLHILALAIVLWTSPSRYHYAQAGGKCPSIPSYLTELIQRENAPTFSTLIAIIDYPSASYFIDALRAHIPTPPTPFYSATEVWLFETPSPTTVFVATVSDSCQYMALYMDRSFVVQLLSEIKNHRSL